MKMAKKAEKNHQSQFLASNVKYAFVTRSRLLAAEIEKLVTSIKNTGWTTENDESVDDGVDFLRRAGIDISGVIDTDLLERSAWNLMEIAKAVNAMLPEEKRSP